MAWLLRNYFLPTLNPSAAAAPAPAAQLPPLAPLLKQYKALLKLTTRDASVQALHQPAIDAVLRAVQRWVAQARVAAPAGAWDDDGDGDGDDDPKERWALDRLADALLDRGALVPLSKKCVCPPLRSASAQSARCPLPPD